MAHSSDNLPPPRPSGMDHEQLLQKIQERFDRLEDKIERYSEKIAKAETDLEWMKGGIKVGLALITAIIGTIISMLFGKTN